MDYAFKELIGKVIEIYQDDLTVFSKERSSHVGYLKQIFERCRNYGISLNPAKLVLGIDQHRSKSQALSSAERDQIFGGADLFLSIALNYQLWCD